MASAERYEEETYTQQLSSYLFEVPKTEDISLEEFRKRFPWMSEEKVEQFKSQIKHKYKGSPPLQAFLDEVNGYQNMQSNAEDLTILEFCNIFPITIKEAMGFNIDRRSSFRNFRIAINEKREKAASSNETMFVPQEVFIDEVMPFKAFVGRIVSLQPSYGETFARRHLNAENFNMQNDQRVL